LSFGVGTGSSSVKTGFETASWIAGLRNCGKLHPMTDPNQSISFPLLVRFSKSGLMRFIGHLDWQALQQSIFITAGLKIAIGSGPTRKLKIKTSPPTPVGVESLTELTYLSLAEALYPEEAQRRLDNVCPEGITVNFCRDAGQMVRKNPFGKIEAASYAVNLGSTITESQLDAVISVLESAKDSNLPENIDPEDVKKFWRRVHDVSVDKNTINLFVKQLDGDTFHAAQCAGFLQAQLDLSDYPIFTKQNYFRVTPSKRKLFS